MADFEITTRNYCFDQTSVASTDGTSVGTSTPDKAIDRSKLTFWETTDAVPDLDIDFGVARTIDSVWFHAENVATYEVYRSNDGIAYTLQHGPVTSIGDYDHALEFTAGTHRYWRLRIASETTPANNTKIYTLIFAEHKLGLDYDDVFADITESIEDVGGGTQRTAVGKMISWSGIRGVDSVKESLQLDMSFFDKSIRDSLFSLWEGPPVREPVVILPFKVLYPDRVYEAAWQDPIFPFTNTGFYGSNEYSGSIRITEV